MVRKFHTGGIVTGPPAMGPNEIAAQLAPGHSWVDTGLFIGGPAAGRKVAIDPAIDFLSVVDETTKKRVDYRRHEVLGVDVTFSLWLWVGTEPDKALAALFEAYEAKHK